MARSSIPPPAQVTGHVDFASEDDVDTAVAAANAAWRTWRSATLTRRASRAVRLPGALLRRRGELAAAITSEHGKVLSDADGEMARGLEVVEFACGIPALQKGEFSESVSTQIDVTSIRQPVGVCGVITPFNFPAMVPLWFAPIAIACGNTVVLKPSEKDPSASVLLAECWAEAGLPPGVFNVVQGDKVAVDAILGHPDIKAVSFVGSTPIARYVYENGTKAGKRVQALGGAKNHMVVLPGRRPRPGRRRRGLGRVRLGGGALHGCLRSRRRRARSGDELVSTDRGPGGEAAGRAWHRRAVGDGAAGHRAAPG